MGGKDAPVALAVIDLPCAYENGGSSPGPVQRFLGVLHARNLRLTRDVFLGLVGFPSVQGLGCCYKGQGTFVSMSCVP